MKRIISIEPNEPVSIGRLMEGSEQSSNLKFASKVVSRHHARILFEDGKIFVQDMKSSSGTFVNGERLSPQGVQSGPRELHDQDILKLGEDYNLNGVLHPAIVMCVNIYRDGAEPQAEVIDIQPAQIPLPPPPLQAVDENHYVDLSQDPQVRANVTNEFSIVWAHLTSNTATPLEKLRQLKQNPHAFAHRQMMNQQPLQLQSRPSVTSSVYAGQQLSVPRLASSSAPPGSDLMARTLLEGSPLNTSLTTDFVRSRITSGSK